MAYQKEPKHYTTIIGMIVPTENNPRFLTSSKNEPYAQVTVKDMQRNKLVGIKIWAEHLPLAKDKLAPGAVIFAEGEYKATEKEGKTYHNVNASTLTILPALSYGHSPDSQELPPQQDDFLAAAAQLEF